MSQNYSHINKVCWCKHGKCQKYSFMCRTRASLCSVTFDASSSSSMHDFGLGDCETVSAEYMEVVWFFPCFRGVFWGADYLRGADISQGITVKNQTVPRPTCWLPLPFKLAPMIGVAMGPDPPTDMVAMDTDFCVCPCSMLPGSTPGIPAVGEDSMLLCGDAGDWDPKPVMEPAPKPAPWPITEKIDTNILVTLKTRIWKLN